MLLLTRRIHEGIVMSGGIRVSVTDVFVDTLGRVGVKLGIDAPRSVTINRDEVEEDIKRNGPRRAA